MSLNFYIESLIFFCSLLFILTNFLNIEDNNKINKFIYLSNILFISFVYLIYYNLIYLSSGSVLTSVTTLLLIIFFFTHFVISLISIEYVRLRLLFIPFFLILILFRHLTLLGSNESNNTIDLFKNDYLLVHIFSSLFSYSMLTISAASAICVIIKSKYLKKITYDNEILNLLPSIYESQTISIRFLYLTMFFLTLSLISGYIYHSLEFKNLDFFFNNKVILSLISLILIFFFFVVRYFKGLTALSSLKIILLSYLFINFAYFGIKIFE